MTGLVLLRRAWRETQSNIAVIGLCLAAIGMLIAPPVSTAEPVPLPERVRGFFCNEKTDSINFLMYQAKGENEEMAANAVNKEIAKASCAYYLPADALPERSARTPMTNGSSTSRSAL